MSDSIITVESLSKRYRLGAAGAGERYTAARDVIAQVTAKPFRALRGRLEQWQGAHRTSPASQQDFATPANPASPVDFWALRDVNFEVKQGEVLGIIGRNGAGKSTLLKVLSRITEPTEGRIKIRGRVASLLEVGTGFHPELTGRENIFLNGAVLGMHRYEIKEKFDEIVAFAEVEKFLDTPVKRYSSGMYVRLAFAVAAHLDPEILIIDEVLAVGDAEFQQKCLGKMESVAHKEGRTVLFVSHNLAAIRSLCPRSLVLASGRVAFDGDTSTATTVYNRKRERVSGEDLAGHRRAGSGDVWITNVTTAASDLTPQLTFLIGEPMEVLISYRVKRTRRGTFFILISTQDGIDLLNVFERDDRPDRELTSAGVIRASIPSDLCPGVYSVAAGIFDADGSFIEWVERVADFEVGRYFFDGRPFDDRLGLTTKKIVWQETVADERQRPNQSELSNV